jgi:hypothetical protein
MFVDMGGGDLDGACQVGDVIVGVTAVKGRDAALGFARASTSS